MRKLILGTVASALCLAFAVPAAAQSDGPGFYFGLGLGGSDFSGDLPEQMNAAYAGNPDAQLVSAQFTDDSGTAKQAIVGYRFTPWFGLELGWQDLGNAQTFYSVRATSGFTTSGRQTISSILPSARLCLSWICTSTHTKWITAPTQSLILMPS